MMSELVLSDNLVLSANLITLLERSLDNDHYRLHFIDDRNLRTIFFINPYMITI